MNYLLSLEGLHNTYYAMRHGQSKANLQKIVISHPENGTHEDYALTELGRQQTKESADNAPLDEHTIIYASDFSRAHETARIVQRALGVPEIYISKKLRERSFGDWEKSDHRNVYDRVWMSDSQDAEHTEHNVESASAVQQRTTSLIKDLEKEYNGKHILLVSHGDTLQILQTGFQKVNAGKHRDMPHLETAEIRELTLAS